MAFVDAERFLVIYITLHYVKCYPSPPNQEQLQNKKIELGIFCLTRDFLMENFTYNENDFQHFSLKIIAISGNLSLIHPIFRFGSETLLCSCSSCHFLLGSLKSCNNRTWKSTLPRSL